MAKTRLIEQTQFSRCRRIKESPLTPRSCADSMTDRDFEHVTHFPVKLWDVVDDDTCDIFTWSTDGHSFFVDDNKYEQEIMDRYPGFVQISSFANLRRLLREYSFDWQNNDTGEFQFSHPSFRKGERDKIFEIRTKRKAIQVAIGQAVKPRRRNSRNAKNSANQSKAWIQPTPSGKVNLRVDTLLRFPEKFWAVVNDTNEMLYWGDNGDTIIVDDKKYEEGIMTKYPGFVQINSFANLRRLLREYGFSWSIRDNGFFEFSHSHMKKDRPELLKGVKTKRKAMKAGSHHPYLPFFRGDGHFHHQNQTAKNYPQVITHNHGDGPGVGEGFEQYEPEIGARSSPEIEQAIGAIQHNHSDGRHFHHHAEQLATASSAVPAHIYGFHPYRIMSTYSPMPSSVNLSSHNSWALPSSGEKMESPFYYPAWNQDNQLRLPVPCGDEEQERTSPTNGTQGSNSENRASSTGSSESVYTSTAKGSPTATFQDTLEMSSQEETSPSFPIVGIQGNAYPSSSGLGHAMKCQSGVHHSRCVDCNEGYQPNSASPSCTTLESPLNVKVESTMCTTDYANLSSNIDNTANEVGDVEREDNPNIMPQEINGNVFKVGFDTNDMVIPQKLEAEDLSCNRKGQIQHMSNIEQGYDLTYHRVKKTKQFRCSTDGAKFATAK